MLDWSIDNSQHPVAIRVPFGPVAAADRPVPTDFSALNTYEVVCRGKDVAILALGNFFTLGQQVCRLLESQGFQPTLVNPRYISGTDTTLLDSLATDHQLVVTLEDGVLDGGFGEKIARHYGPTAVRTLCYGGRKQFVDRYAPAEFLAAHRLVDTMIAEDIVQSLSTSH